MRFKSLRNRTIEERFWEKVDKKGDSECWEWQGSRAHRYGVIKFSNSRKQISVHKFSYEIHYGKVPDQMCVMHSCDNTYCVNPRHLFLGTQLENQMDSINKGRHSTQKLAPDDVIRIRDLYKTGDWTHSRIAEMFGVTRRAIGLVLTHDRWWHVK